MALKRENIGNHKDMLYIRSGGDEEFAAFEQLGPCVQQALREGPIKSSSIAILGQITEKNAEIELQNVEREKHGAPLLRLLDPMDPALDVYLARGFMKLNAQNLMKDRSERDAMLGVTPIVTKISVKSIREQRRSMRRVRF